MGIFVDSNFESDAIGSSPAGFYTFNLGGSVQHGGDPNPASAGGDHCFQFSASGGLGVGPVQGLTIQTSVTINFSLKNLLNLGLSNLLISVNSNNVLNTSGVQLAAIGYNADGTFYVQSGSVFICASADPLEFDVWMYLQVDLVFGSIIVMGTNFVNVNAQVTLNGKKIADSGAPITSSVTVASCPLGLGVNDYEFSPPGFLGGLIDNITISTPSNGGTPYFPHPGSPFARLTQADIEVVEAVTNANLRLTQGAIEVLESPTTANLRLTQAVIELVTAGGGGGWEIYEA